MEYDPDVPLQFYEALGEKEWKRLSSTPLGELLFHVHMDVFDHRLRANHDVLELGAGCGFFTKELVEICGSVITSDLSPKQLAINREKMAELGLEKRIRDFMLLDTGIQDPDHYPVENRHFVHMMKDSELEALLANQKVRILEKRSAGLFALAEDVALKEAREDEEDAHAEPDTAENGC